MNKVRKFVTTGVGFTFLVVGITGVVFKFFFKNHPLEEIHGWIGVAMFAAVIFHVLQNWKPLQNHLRDWRVYGLLIPIALVVAFFAFSPSQSRRGPGLNPREIMNRLSQADANDLAKAFGKDINSVFTAMKNDGLKVSNANETIKEIAQLNQRPPDSILSYFIK